MKIPHVGIDLGTTFSCMSYIGEDGIPVVIKNDEGKETTPSVIWFDGKTAYVGDAANDRKIMANAPIYEMVKRDIGRDTAHRYRVQGYDYGAYGFSAIILKKFKQEAFRFFKSKNWLAPDERIDDVLIPAVITVPAQFGDKERLHTRIAGIAAGFDVMAIINEPTAAALTYGIQLEDTRKIFVFDLGGGTFDATIMQVSNGEVTVLASDGASEVGGKDWDALIVNYLLYKTEDILGREVPDAYLWELKKKALEAKFSLSTEESTTVSMLIEGKLVEIPLYRESKKSDALPDGSFDDFIDDDWEDDKFYFEQRSANLLTNIKAIIIYMLENIHLGWNDIDDIVLVGGACRMPMIPKMMEELSGKKIHKNISGIDLDTAISFGATLFGKNRSRVTDVTPKAIGIEVIERGRTVVEHLIRKNTPLPVKISQNYKAVEKAVLKVYEGENDSRSPDECVLRGRLELDNKEGEVKVELSIDFSGFLIAAVEADGVKAELKIKSEEGDIDVSELTGRINQINVICQQTIRS